MHGHKKVHGHGEEEEEEEDLFVFNDTIEGPRAPYRRPFARHPLLMSNGICSHPKCVRAHVCGGAL